MAKKTTKKKATKKAAKKSASKKASTKAKPPKATPPVKHDAPVNEPVPEKPKHKHPEVAQAVMDAISASIRAGFYSQHMVGKIVRDHDLSPAQARATITAVTEPILSELNQK